MSVLISLAPPPLPPTIGVFDDTAALCQTRGLGFGPEMLLTSVLGPISDYFKTKSQEKIAKKQLALQAQELKAEKEDAAREYAMSQAQSLTQNSAEKRRDQTIVLAAVGGAAVLIAALLIVGAAKARKG